MSCQQYTLLTISTPASCPTNFQLSGNNSIITSHVNFSQVTKCLGTKHFFLFPN